MNESAIDHHPVYQSGNVRIEQKSAKMWSVAAKGSAAGGGTEAFDAVTPARTNSAISLVQMRTAPPTLWFPCQARRESQKTVEFVTSLHPRVSLG